MIDDLATKTVEDISCDNLCPGQDLNWAHPQIRV
jgi:hypothetical protein